jgi:hypothetical protein
MTALKSGVPREPRQALVPGVVRLGERAEYPASAGSDVRPVYLESLGDPVLLVLRHIPTSLSVIEMTDANRVM